MDGLLIFDFDGVIADSEALANSVLAEVVSELGVPTTLDDAYNRYMGKRFPEVIEEIEAVVGKALHSSFAADVQSRTLARFRRELRIVDGAADFIKTFENLPKCIASSSAPDRLAFCLEVLELHDTFGPHVYSASIVSRGKPHPDIFLHAAQEMRVPPSRSVVIEDSVSGVEAGVAAGMTVIGLLAASHIQDGHQDRLRRAGAQHLANSFEEATTIVKAFLANQGSA